MKETFPEKVKKEMKIFEFHSFDDKDKDLYKALATTPARFYQQAIGFYNVFKSVMENGYRPITEFKSMKTPFPIQIHTWENLPVAIVNFHFAIELILKGVILKKNGNGIPYIHDINKLLEKSQIDKSLFDEEEKSILDELSEENSIKIRYMQGTISIRTYPPQKILNLLQSIFTKIEKAFRECMGWIE